MSHPMYADSSSNNRHPRISNTITKQNRYQHGNIAYYGKWIVGTNNDDIKDLCRIVCQKKRSMIQSMMMQFSKEKHHYNGEAREIRYQHLSGYKYIPSTSSSSVPIRWEERMVRILQAQCSQLSVLAIRHGKNIQSNMENVLVSTRKLHQKQLVTTLAEDQEVTTNDATGADIIVNALSQPLIDETIWDRLDGTEFQRYPEIWNDLAKIGEKIAINDKPNEWIDWNAISNHDNKSLDDGATIHVWTGKSVKPNVRGSNLPWIKTRSLIPFTPKEMVELLLDSERVKSYNQWSLGRKDCWVATSIVPIKDNDDSVSPFSLTKIVKNRVQPPLGAKQIISTTLLHAQPSDVSSKGNSDSSANNPSWIVVSRAVGGKRFYEPEYDDDVGTSEMLFGVNVIQPYDDQHSILTAVTHVYSSAVPVILAERVGVKSAIKFVQDMRSLKENKLTATR